ncbi:MAG: O-antigen ligase family protein [Armatimonadota bacterium]|nr:O-antigen ligase family protein [Armatimonadota bacterium]
MIPLFKTIFVRIRRFCHPLVLLSWIVYLLRWIRFVYRARIRPLARKARARLIPAALVSILSYMLAQQIIAGDVGKAAMLLVAISLMSVLINRSHLAVMAVLALQSTIFYESALPRPISFGGSGLGTGETLLILVLFAAVVRAYSEKRHVPSALTIPIIFLFIAVLLALIISYREYQANPRGFYDFKAAYGGIREMLGYLFFFGLLYGIRDKRELRLVVNVAIGLAAMVSMVVILQYIMGNSVKLFLGTPESSHFTATVGGEDKGISRLQPPGLPLMLLMLLTTLYMAAAHRGKSGRMYGALAALMASGVVLSFARNAWISTMVALLLLLVMCPLVYKGRLIGLMAGAILGGLVLSLGIAAISPGHSAGLRKAIVRRFETIITVRKTYDEPGVKNRRDENERALRTALKHPVWGVGLGNPSAYMYFKKQSGGYIVRPEIGIHNSYLDMWTQYGIFGLIAFAWISVAFLYRCLRLWRKADELWIRCIGLGFALNYVGLLMRSSVVMMLIRQDYEITVAAFMWGIVEAASALATPRRKKDLRYELATPEMPHTNTESPAPSVLA